METRTTLNRAHTSTK